MTKILERRAGKAEAGRLERAEWKVRAPGMGNYPLRVWAQAGKLDDAMELLFGSDPKVMAEAARVVEGLGFDLVDLNLGCPAPIVYRKCAGGGLLRDPQRNNWQKVGYLIIAGVAFSFGSQAAWRLYPDGRPMHLPYGSSNTLPPLKRRIWAESWCSIRPIQLRLLAICRSTRRRR